MTSFVHATSKYKYRYDSHVAAGLGSSILSFLQNNEMLVEKR